MEVVSLQLYLFQNYFIHLKNNYKQNVKIYNDTLTVGNLTAYGIFTTLFFLFFYFILIFHFLTGCFGGMVSERKLMLFY